MTAIRSHVRLGAAVVASGLLLLAACGGDDDADPVASTPSTTTAATTFATLATVPPTEPSAPATDPTSTDPTSTDPGAEPGGDGGETYTIVEGDSLFAIAERLGVSLDALVEVNGWPDGIDHLILPGDEILVPGTDGGEATTDEGADGGGYTDSAVSLPFDGDRTMPITEPLADGTYFSGDYTSDGSTVTFTLTQYFLCDSTTNVPEEPSVVCASGFGTLDDPTASVVMASDADVAVATGDLDDPTRADVTAAEFARLVAGEPPSADAPAGYEFGNFLAFVEVVDGRAVAVQQFYTS